MWRRILVAIVFGRPLRRSRAAKGIATPGAVSFVTAK